MSFEDNVAENKSMCQGCPITDKCPTYIGFMSQECKQLLKENGELELNHDK